MGTTYLTNLSNLAGVAACGARQDLEDLFRFPGFCLS